MKKAILLLALICVTFTACDKQHSDIKRYENSGYIESDFTFKSPKTEIVPEFTSEAPFNDISRNVNLSYKVAQILYNEYLDFERGKFAGWWVDEEEIPHMCLSILLVDLNNDGNFEILSQKHTSDFKKYYSLYSYDGELLFSSYDDYEQLYEDGNKYYVEFIQSAQRSIFVTIADEQYDNEIYSPFESDYLYIDNKVEACIYEQYKADSAPFDNEVFCRYFAPDSGFEEYYGDYTSQMQQLSATYKNELKNYPTLLVLYQT